MESSLLHIFHQEIERQARFSILAFQDLGEALKQLQKGGADHDHSLVRIAHDRIWYSLQALLIAAGNLSKLFWPSKSQCEERGRELRESLKVPGDSPLQPRKFRNHFEHFDERLHEWASSSPHRNFVDSNIGPLNAIQGIDPEDLLRNFDPQSATLTYRGDTYELLPMIESIQVIHQRAVEKISLPPWPRSEGPADSTATDRNDHS